LSRAVRPAGQGASGFLTDARPVLARTG
jgi:hypothetical protein